MRLFLTGSTGFLGSYVATELLETRPDLTLALLVRAKSREQALDKLWKGWQLHLGPTRFRELLDRVELVPGDLHAPGLGLDPDQRAELVADLDSVLHIAASLNRKSSKACFNTNLRGTLSVLQLAREAKEGGGLRRFSQVTTTAIAGHRHREDVHEDEALDWDRSDYDPYGRTKKFCEHLAAELLPDVDRVVFRPSIVLGDSRFPETTQFDMIRALSFLADLPVIPIRGSSRVDIVPADWVGHAICTVHLQEGPTEGIYHLSAGRRSPTARQIRDALAPKMERPKGRFAPFLDPPTQALFERLDRLPRGNPAQAAGAVMKVFWPYITYDTVFVNDRAVAATGQVPPSFVDYGPELYRWCKDTGFSYPHVALPPARAEVP